MKLTVTITLLLLSFVSKAQVKTPTYKIPLTNKYAGVYRYGTGAEKGRVGEIIIYPETDSTVLFYMDLNRGAPSYNMGSLYGRVKIVNDKGLFYKIFDNADEGCKFSFNFKKNSLIINTVDKMYNCGFGHAVFADGTFKRKSKKCKEFFQDIEGQKKYFRNTSPEQYYKH